MSWLYLQALAGGCSQVDCSTGEPSAPSSTIPTGKRSCSRAKRTAASILSRSGMTFAVSTDDLGVELWMSSLVETRAPKQAACAGETISPIHRHSPTSSCASSEKSNRNMSCARIRPMYAATRRGPDGALLLLCGGWDTTPGLFGSMPAVAGQTMNVGECGCSPNYPTPVKNDYKAGLSATRISKGFSPLLGNVLGGVPHPEFVEELMGWPIGWTDLRPLATARFRLWLRRHGGCFAPTKVRKTKALQTLQSPEIESVRSDGTTNSDH